MKILLTLALALLMLTETGAAAPMPAEEALRGPAFASAAAGLPGGEAGTLLARSKKKKNTAAPTAAPSPSPAPRRESAAPETVGGVATPTPVPEGPIIDPRSIADYLFAHDMQLPDNFITKKQARELGWDSARNYVSDVAPGKSIGGDYFGNYEQKLPTGRGISYYEADCWYTGGRRNATRIIYSTDGRVWYTEDHYETFEELFPTVP